MNNKSVQQLPGYFRSAITPVAVVAIWAMTGISSGLAQQSAQSTYRSAAEASNALFRAVQHNDSKAIINILGGLSELASCQDEAQDKLDRARFVEKFHEMQRLRRETDGSVTLYIGAENWPFPIPLVEKDGAWHFDQEVGLKEVLYRRIGENELTAIAICHDFVSAERVSTTKTAADSKDSSPVSAVAEAVSESAGGDPVLFRGYYFQILGSRPTNGTRRSRFTLIAYPAEYRTSGVMTFMVTEKDVVFEKDLGEKTSRLVKSLTKFRKDSTWRASDE